MQEVQEVQEHFGRENFEIPGTFDPWILSQSIVLLYVLTLQYFGRKDFRYQYYDFVQIVSTFAAIFPVETFLVQIEFVLSKL